jgi:hypothetical protein
MALSKLQKRAVLALDWLYSPDNRREGRSYAQAVAMIRIAARNPGLWVEINDHASTEVADRHALEGVLHLIHNDPYLRRWCERLPAQRRSFRFSSQMQPIESWYPQEEPDDLFISPKHSSRWEQLD